uniref:Tripartite motif-containing protein 16 n=1 Tax=Oncorhynchus kisutch TaxID=8019 RepID=A0A8C7JMD5_ONCKI
MGTTFIPIKFSDLQEVARGCLTTIFLVDCILPPSIYYTNYEWKLSSDCDGQSHTVSCPIFTLARGSSHKIIALTLVSFFHNIHGFICPRRTLKGKIAKQYPEAFSNAHESPVLEDDEFDPIPPSVATMITATTSEQSTESCDTSPDVISPNKQLGGNNLKSQQRIQEREKEMQELRQAVDSLKRSAQAELFDSERTLTELIHSVEKRRSEVKELISAQEKAQVSRAKRHLKQLEQEVAGLRRRDAELKHLSQTEDHIHFLQHFQSLCVPLGSEGTPSIIVTFEHVKKFVTELKERLQDICKEEMDRIYGKVAKVPNICPSEPKTREEFLEYCCLLTLDPNTANQLLCLSEGNRKVTRSHKIQTYPNHEHRFSHWKQVLCKEGVWSVSEPCYWEVEWTGVEVDIAVSYKGISRRGSGHECWFGANDQSWRLYCSASRCCFYHNGRETSIPAIRSDSRVGVYLDHGAGTLSFYSVTVSDTMTLLHGVKTTFTRPLYPGFGVGSSVRILTPFLRSN